jgi:hypothetical protein
MQAENDAKYGRTNPKHKHGPFHEAGKLFSQSSGAITKPLDQFTDVVGKVGGYVDDQIGRVVNPTSQVDKNGFSDAHIAGQRWLWARLKTAKGSFSTVPGAEAYLKKLGLEATRHMSAAYQTESVRERIARAQQIYTDFIEGADYAFKKHYQNQHPSSENPRRNPEVPSSDSVLLTVNEKGTQLYLTGGDQSIDLSSLKITGPAADKEHIVLGDVTHIVYRTQKDFDKFQPTDYIHEFSEDSGGPPPELVYDRINERLSLVGGVYFIKQPMLKTSPGIED